MTEFPPPVVQTFTFRRKTKVRTWLLMVAGGLAVVVGVLALNSSDDSGFDRSSLGAESCARLRRAATELGSQRLAVDVAVAQVDESDDVRDILRDQAWGCFD